MGSIERDTRVDLDVIIIGAGISGINAGYRVQTELPAYQYTILEARDAIGGTWDLFRYPGIRSDSDLHTFGFPWRPWSKSSSIADGPSIRQYIRESAEINGIDKKIRFHNKLLAADWSSSSQRWTLSVDADGEKTQMSARFIIFSTGYYDYNTPLKASIPGIDNFQGKTIHPQFWPEDYDYTGKKMIIIGSGATAITLLPNLAEKAAHVTILQRSPSYIMALPAVDPMGNFIRKWFPTWLAHTLVRWKFLILPFIFFKFCRAFPNAARKVIQGNTKKQLGDCKIPLDPNFKPSYNPWEQRLCVCPDGDFFKALHRGNADMVTDTIKTVTATGIQTDSGKIIEADVIITATGLKMQLAGGSKITVDNKPIDVSTKYVWKGVMLQDVPNAAIVIGYTNASWTLGADATARLVCRLLKKMDQEKEGVATATLEPELNLTPSPMLNLNSTYIEKAKGDLPKSGDIAPWKPRSNYLTDYWVAGYGNLNAGLKFSKMLKKVN
ncbi:monooxygenase flavin-binding family protein-like protein [Rhexocercosporidium sp. MPI-PUGE-AT-0058]|nr:monooxygenase flavin-binding family protein-like protein [Rhexocercosporidium sp. MPI-PUGE-AT-0058]